MSSGQSLARWEIWSDREKSKRHARGSRRPIGSLPSACKAKGLEAAPTGGQKSQVIRGIVKALHRPRQREIRGQRTRLRGKLRRGRRSLVAPQGRRGDRRRNAQRPMLEQKAATRGINSARNAA